MFKVRTSAPTTWNKLYNNYNNGGLSWCINGNPTNPVANVLANCVGYACSRFNEIYNEITGYDGMKYKELCCNAEDFWNKAKAIGLKRGQKPKAGAIMVWEGLGSLAGHVCIVERVYSNTQVYTSESGYNSAYFWNATRYKGSGNWGANGNYRFLGFIYNPAVKKKNVVKSVKYRVYDIKKRDWLSAVKDGAKATTEMHRLGGVAVKATTGKIEYCVHILHQKWLPKVTGYDTDNFNNGFAGDYGIIDGFAINARGIKLAYRVRTEQNGWLPWVYSNKFNLHDPKAGYAGNLGEPITNIQIKVV